MSAKEAINDKLQGSVATYLMCDGVVNNQLKKGLLTELWPRVCGPLFWPTLYIAYQQTATARSVIAACHAWNTLPLKSLPTPELPCRTNYTVSTDTRHWLFLLCPLWRDLELPTALRNNSLSLEGFEQKKTRPRT